jgi:hypothetical protein
MPAKPLAKPAAPLLGQTAAAIKQTPARRERTTGKARTSKSKEEMKEEMKMRNAIEEKVIEWTQDEKETMLRLPRKECTCLLFLCHHTHTRALDPLLTLPLTHTDILENERVTLLGLIDLVFAYAYNQRTTMVRTTTRRHTRDHDLVVLTASCVCVCVCAG